VADELLESSSRKNTITLRKYKGLPEFSRLYGWIFINSGSFCRGEITNYNTA